MALVNGKVLLDLLHERKQIGGAYNTINLETTLGILRAIEKSGIPSFIQIAPTNTKLGGYDVIYDLVSRYSQSMETPVALHLDHGKSFKDFKNACDSNFTSVMIDGASFDFEENIKFTKRAVDYAKGFGISVEAELGAIGGKEDDISEAELKTDPNQIVEFVKRTGIDMLAISIGNVHGLDDQPSIDFDLLESISNVSPVPLVIHGGSGIPIKDIQKMNNFNVKKINIASDLRKAYIRSFAKLHNKNNDYANLIEACQIATDTVEEVVYNSIASMNKIS